MTDAKLQIVQLNTLDTVGGAAGVTGTLHEYFRSRGHFSLRVVGRKLGQDPDTVELRSAVRPSLLGRVGQFGRTVRRRAGLFAGLEDPGDPASRHLESILPTGNEIIVCHNLHGGYFDLAGLADLSLRHPVVLVLHDAWLLAGHCAHSFDCDKWRSGCGGCPYLEVQYSLTRDTSHENWERKRDIYRRCRLHVITPSQWLMDKVEDSILKPAVIQSRVINNGVDSSIFCPGARGGARQQLGISGDEHVVMFAAHGIRESIWKDYATMRSAVAKAAQALPYQRLRFLAVGESAPDEHLGAATVTFVPHQAPSELAAFYRAADLYIHAARAENFPNTVLEALSCGTPVVATAVGGIPEQVKGLRLDGDASGLNLYGPGEATGVLTPAGDAEGLGFALCHLLGNKSLLEQLSVSAAKDAKERFSINRTGAQYLDFFDEVAAGFGRKRRDD
ncbi:glycosyltransferase [Geomonas propionica]|uniref:Glycosyltransferase n=1 Tax=Geomonas propionica TaxID=2798582 RepID=A0ABS0YMM6_9BACT|nr:glycosyltransferase [Geomonas propionica]MBJ6799244.1 glycosyltransferase [Geomonas propionica]